jgi:hypothetical protein
VKARKSPTFLNEQQFEKFWAKFNRSDRYDSETKKLIHGLWDIIRHSSFHSAEVSGRMKDEKEDKS